MTATGRSRTKWQTRPVAELRTKMLGVRGIPTGRGRKTNTGPAPSSAKTLYLDRPTPTLPAGPRDRGAAPELPALSRPLPAVAVLRKRHCTHTYLVPSRRRSPTPPSPFRPSLQRLPSSAHFHPNPVRPRALVRRTQARFSSPQPRLFPHPLALDEILSKEPILNCHLPLPG